MLDKGGDFKCCFWYQKWWEKADYPRDRLEDLKHHSEFYELVLGMIFLSFN
jgi:hypothetical protein